MLKITIRLFPVSDPQFCKILPGYPAGRIAAHRDLVDIRGGPVRKLQHVPEGRHIQIYHEAVDRHLAKVGTHISDAALFHLFLYHFIFMIGQFQEKLFRSCKTHFLILSTFKQRSQSKDNNYHLIVWDRRLMLILSTSLL